MGFLINETLDWYLKQPQFFFTSRITIFISGPPPQDDAYSQEDGHGQDSSSCHRTQDGVTRQILVLVPGRIPRVRRVSGGQRSSESRLHTTVCSTTRGQGYYCWDY